MGPVIGILVALGVAVAGLAMVGAYYCKKKSDGYKWMSEEELNKLSNLVRASPSPSLRDLKVASKLSAFKVCPGLP